MTNFQRRNEGLMKVFDKYVFKNLAIATAFVTVTLVIVVFLSQSLRFLELVIDSGASSAAFWMLTFLALPRFFEVIMPLSLMAATIFIYNRMTMDSEIVAIRSAGFSPYALARPAMILALIVTFFLWGITFWAAPKSIAGMYRLRLAVKTQFSAFMFREGVFNQVGNGLTVYIRDRAPDGQMRGIMIYDGREENKKPSTILAKRGGLLAESDGRQVVVFDGARHEYDPKTGKLQKLNFERYSIDLPESGRIRERWKEPDERTFFELFHPDPASKRDTDSRRAFMVEIHRRVAAPILAIAFTAMACAALLLGPLDRRGQGWRIAACVAAAAALQGAFLGAFNLSKQADLGLPLMHALVWGPLLFSWFSLRGYRAHLADFSRRAA